MITVCARLPRGLVKDLKKIAATKKRTVSNVLLLLVENAVKDGGINI